MTIPSRQWGMLAATIALGACAGAPQAPTVSEWRKEAINTREALELQSCKSSLNNTQLLLEETSRLANAASSALAGVANGCANPPTSRPDDTADADVSNSPVPAPTTLREAPRAGANRVYLLPFAFGSTIVDLTDASAMDLADAVRDAPLIVVRGRTDGSIANWADEAIARGRAQAVADYLHAIGVSNERIRVTHQGVGDHVADNSTREGRALNRRAEIEVYGASPPREHLLATRADTPRSTP
jgi:outer membrane protein OmpA-like peptidoglycan-associated protein